VEKHFLQEIGSELSGRQKLEILQLYGSHKTGIRPWKLDDFQPQHRTRMPTGRHLCVVRTSRCHVYNSLSRAGACNRAVGLFRPRKVSQCSTMTTSGFSNQRTCADLNTWGVTGVTPTSSLWICQRQGPRSNVAIYGLITHHVVIIDTNVKMIFENVAMTYITNVKKDISRSSSFMNHYAHLVREPGTRKYCNDDQYWVPREGAYAPARSPQTL
jgi:hypothetical protein